eukprot:IDg13459t1
MSPLFHATVICFKSVTVSAINSARRRIGCNFVTAHSPPIKMSGVRNYQLLHHPSLSVQDRAASRPKRFVYGYLAAAAVAEQGNTTKEAIICAVIFSSTGVKKQNVRPTQRGNNSNFHRFKSYSESGWSTEHTESSTITCHPTSIIMRSKLSLPIHERAQRPTYRATYASHIGRNCAPSTSAVSRKLTLRSLGIFVRLKSCKICTARRAL